MGDDSAADVFGVVNALKLVQLHISVVVFSEWVKESFIALVFERQGSFHITISSVLRAKMLVKYNYSNL